MPEKDEWRRRRGDYKRGQDGSKSRFGRLNLTMLYLVQDKYDLAAQHSTEVVRTRPNNPIAIKRSAEAMVGLSLWEEAIDLLEGAISSQIGDVDAMALLRLAS